MELTQDAQKVIEVVQRLGGRPLIVGGSVRDRLLGIESKDIDIEVHGAIPPALLACELEAVGRVDAVGQSFGVLKFGRDVDVSFPRRESKKGEGHRAFEIVLDPDISLHDALARRDFTINSMAFDPVSGEFIDLFGGREDLEAGILRHTSPAFGEDPLRPMRGVQFAARFGFKMAPETAALCRWMLPQHRTVAKERFWEEWFKILTKGKDFEAFQTALRDTAIDQLAPAPLLARKGDVETRVAAQFEGSPLKPHAILASWALSVGGGQAFTDFMSELDVPHAWRKTVDGLRGGFVLLTTPSRIGLDWARTVARSIHPATLRDVGKIMEAHEYLMSNITTAGIAGVLDGPTKVILTGEHLKGVGLEPGPIFGQILKASIQEQDREGWTTEAQALGWLATLDLSTGQFTGSVRP